MSPAGPRIVGDNAALLIVDIQDRLSQAMPADTLAAVKRNVGILIDAAGRFEIPVVVSRQYPQGLGDTLPEIDRQLAALGTVHRVDKVEFSVCGAAGFSEIFSGLGVTQWIVVGMESHVCVFQTVRDLCATGATVFVPADAVASRTATNRLVGVDLMNRAGAVPTSTEAIVFDLLGSAASEHFKPLSRLIR